MSIHNEPLSFEPLQGEDYFNPTLVAQIASRIYNENPGVSNVANNDHEGMVSRAGFGDSLQNSGRVLPEVNSDDAPDLSSIGNFWEPDCINPVDQIAGTSSKPISPLLLFNRLEVDPKDYYFLRGNEASKDVPLSTHTNNLVSQQNFSENKDSAPSLKQFVQKMQMTPGGFSSKPQVRPNFQTDIFDVGQIRKDFPVLHQYVHGKPLVWLDNAATTQKPQCVIDAVASFYSHDNSNIHRGAHTLAARATDAYEGAREKVRQFIGAESASEIIFVRGTTEAINLVAQTWGRKNIQPGDELLVSLLEHHANIVPWQMLAKEKGAILRPIPVNDHGEILLEEYSRLLNPRTKLVSITQASNGLGTILPVKEMIRLAKRYDVKVLVDGAQSVAHLPVNVQEIDADFFVFSGHKIFAPTGIGVVYGKKEILENMPPWQGGGNMIRNVTFEETTFNELPNKFEAGTPNVADAIGLGAAIDYVNKIGLRNIAEYEHKLTVYGTEQLSQVPGLRLIGTAREKVGVLSFVLGNIPTEHVGRYLDQEGIAVRAGHHCAQPALRRFGVETTVRPSLAFYNTFGEIDRLVSALKILPYR